MDGYIVVNLLSSLLIITSLMLLLSKNPGRAAYVYSGQALVLVAIFAVLGFTTGSEELYTWSITSFFTKVILVPAIILFALKKMKAKPQDMPPRFSPALSVVLVVVEVTLCFFVVNGIELPTALEVKPALAVSLAHFFIGLTCIISQRNIVKQIFGYCLMENGSHVSLALLAPEAPKLVEIGIATDAVLAVAIMAILAVRIYRSLQTLDSNEITRLKG